MNDQGILLLSDALKMILLLSFVVAVLVLWSNLRAKRSVRLKDARTPNSRLRDLMDDQRRK